MGYMQGKFLHWNGYQKNHLRRGTVRSTCWQYVKNKPQNCGYLSPSCFYDIRNGLQKNFFPLTLASLIGAALASIVLICVLNQNFIHNKIQLRDRQDKELDNRLWSQKRNVTSAQPQVRNIALPSPTCRGTVNSALFLRIFHGLINLLILIKFCLFYLKHIGMPKWNSKIIWTLRLWTIIA